MCRDWQGGIFLMVWMNDGGGNASATKPSFPANHIAHRHFLAEEIHHGESRGKDRFAVNQVGSLQQEGEDLAGEKAVGRLTASGRGGNDVGGASFGEALRGRTVEGVAEKRWQKPRPLAGQRRMGKSAGNLDR